MDILNEVAERLVRFRTAAGLDPERAADATGIPAERLADAERAQCALDDDDIARVASAYGVDPTEIFGGRVTPVRDYAGGA
ncbi:MAG TPA: helix-turn-helix transcriptional regulator [Candidatus Elarobacter sp.]|nr:helix-turn-helix transcriptional regulator [Candidatus Elarobacter sp.]